MTPLTIQERETLRQKITELLRSVGAEGITVFQIFDLVDVGSNVGYEEVTKALHELKGLGYVGVELRRLDPQPSRFDWYYYDRSARAISAP